MSFNLYVWKVGGTFLFLYDQAIIWWICFYAKSRIKVGYFSKKKKKLSGLYLINNWDKPSPKKKKFGINGVYLKRNWDKRMRNIIMNGSFVNKKVSGGIC